MSRIATAILAAAALAAAGALSPSYALSTKECSAKYQAAKEAKTLNGMNWNQFRKAMCSSDSSTATKTTAPKGIRFPSKVSSKYAKESPGKARMHTCLDQYHAEKAANRLNGLKWIQKGGGYYSLCNARLKS